MKRPAFIAAFAALMTALPSIAAPESYTLDPNHTYPSWEVVHFGFSPQRGRFNRTEGKVTVDREAKSGTVEVTIDVSSLDTGHEKLEAHLKGEEYFNAAKYPTITFRGSGFAFDGDRVKSVAGDLTIAGRTRPVTLEASSFTCAPHPVNKRPMCGGEFVAKIKRSEFGIERFVPGVSDETILRIGFEARRD